LPGEVYDVEQHLRKSFLTFQAALVCRTSSLGLGDSFSNCTSRKYAIVNEALAEAEKKKTGK
jgi:hypothetical protein